MAPSDRTGRRVSNGLVALGSAAVLTVYAAGYTRTREAADRLAESERRRPFVPALPEAGPPDSVPEPPAETRVATAATPPSAPEAPADTTASPPVARPPASTPTRRRETVPTAREEAGPVATPSRFVATALPLPMQAADSTAIEAPVVQTSDAPASTSAATGSEAPATTPATTAPVTPKVPLRDGTYTGYGTSRHGDIEATLVVEHGRIVSAAISKCYTRWPCSWIKLLPPQVVEIQSPEVDFITGATVSTYAFYYAVIDALSKAQ